MRPSLLRLVPLALAALSGCARNESAASSPVAGAPVVQDERLELSLLASDPEIQTPIGIAIDRQDRIFVLESHTHSPGSEYRGPKTDRVRVFIDRDRTRRADSSYIFADGLEDGMNLAFSPSGDLHVVTAKGVVAFHDRDRHGVSDGRTAILRLVEPEKVYDHAALLGIVFAPDGWMYISRGNTGGSPWKLVGTDGSSVGGYGDGGSVVRARPDGSDVQEFATGFWNPFDIKVDAAGRVLTVDNDPDSRGPNRLLHLVEGGDYGYKSLYGKSGIHPYQSWNAELPGTLPYAAPLGEAPAGLFDASRAALPTDYRNHVLVTVWEESNIVPVPLSPRGASVEGKPKVLIQGGADFHPVAFAVDSRGTLYITDWKVRAYPNHGQGRIWRLTTKRGVKAMHPRREDTALADPGARTLAEVAALSTPGDMPRVRSALLSTDPFLRHAGVMALSRLALREAREAAARDTDANVRLGAVLAMTRARAEGSEAFARGFLSDPDERIRRMALVWIGGQGMASLRGDIDRALTVGTPSGGLFEVYLATVAQLEPDFLRAYRARSTPTAKEIPQPLPPRFLERFVADAAQPVALRAMAISYLEEPRKHVAMLAGQSRRGNAEPIRLEAVRSLAYVSDAAAGQALLAVASDPAAGAELRTEALLGLARQGVDATGQALALLDDPDANVQLEAARYLRSRSGSDDVRAALQRKLSTVGATGDAGLREQLQMALATDGKVPGRPENPQDWARAVSEGGDAARGRRVFHSLQSTCSQCHVSERRGGTLGPDLSNIGSSKTRPQILQSIIHPSAEISPEFQGWYIRTKDGQTHYGRQMDMGGTDRGDMLMMNGKFESFRDIQAYGPAEKSLMPEGLQSRLTVAEMKDLLTYLQHAR